MPENSIFLKQLISTSGLSGHEKRVRNLISDAWKPLVDEVSVSRLGSLHALKKGRLDRRLLISAHMDSIGLIISSIEDGFMHVTSIGGIDARVMPGQAVTIHGKVDLAGVVALPPEHLLPEESRESPAELDDLLIDTGLSHRQLTSQVKVGDLVSFAQPPVDLMGDTLAGPSLDNRASVAALTHCLEELQIRGHSWNVFAVASSQEEITLGGAATSAYALQPDIAIAIDVTHGTGPGTPSHKSCPLNKGPVLGWGPNIHPALFKHFKTLADRIEIPYQTEVMPSHSGTDAYSLQVARQGIPTIVISIPLRYMHTPVELVAIKDVQRTGRLLAEFITQLDEKFMDTLTWDD